VNEVADGEFGGPEELVIGLGGEQFGEGAEILLGGVEQSLEDALGAVGLFGGELRGGHGKPSVNG
jgi:hypothetical protein